MLAAVASAMLLVPIMTLVRRRPGWAPSGDRRLAALRLLGATSADVTWLTTLETMLQAAVGFVAGTLVYLVTLPGWGLLTFQGQPLGADAGDAAAAAVDRGDRRRARRPSRGSRPAGSPPVGGAHLPPLGVARSAGRAWLRLVRLLGIAVVIGGWLVVAPIVGRLDTALAAVLIVVSLALFQGTTNLVGPLLVQSKGTVLRRGRGAVGVLASTVRRSPTRRGPGAAGGLAAVGFAAGRSS